MKHELCIEVSWGYSTEGLLIYSFVQQMLGA